MIFTPVFFTEEEYKENYQSSPQWVDKDFLDVYYEKLADIEVIAAAAKVYVLENWEKVNDWTKFIGEIESGYDGKSVYFLGTSSNPILGLEIPNPLTEVTSVVLDPTDGDFSITANGVDYWWITDSSVIQLADFVSVSCSNA